MKCPNCASVIPDASNFCGVCGADLRSLAEAPAVSNQTVVLSSMSTAVDGPSYSADEPEAVEAPAPVDAPKPEAASEAAPVAEAAAPAPAAAPAAPAQEAPSEPSVQEAVVPEQPATQIDTSAVSTPPSEEAQAQPSLPPVEVGGSVSGSADAQAGGGFRETLWFMQAQDPESLEAIQNEDHNLESLNESYEDDGNVLDTQVREKFSLNISDAAASKMSAELNGPSTSADFGDDDDIESPSDNRGKMIAAAVVVLLIIGGVMFMM